ncbi:MAG: alpha/beta hydrolase [Rhodospirillaceae bacterium]|jgi:pimeloyl-ACP methyl ester carboxylesterase|nr:alpha/beta hydrolase [Rhodospirillaceae bacterium]MBT4487917.1 alpha/beta hydrolase [Rhodospirillaceae bacterium]MBT5195275.1 alpha/beta hydrolase [Rhodospirillaceae bacterium]MBT5894947.1 alpha/beta hydrolase [Rhodospirillaceae bacterium]MBT6429667.1 alpha/beta hydrolase [Rhodospirillaceae bacterium]
MPHIQAEGAKLYYEEVGIGDPIIFVHEFADDLRSWEPQMRFFSRRYRCISYNARGYPPSDIPSDPALYSQDLAADDIAAVMRGLDIEKAHVVGCSMGAFATLHFGLRYAQMARSLVVLGCGYGAKKDSRDGFNEEVAALAQSFRDKGMIEVGTPYSLGPTRVQFQNKDPRGFADFQERFLGHSSEGTGLTMAGVQAKRPSLYDLEDGLRKLVVPTLLVIGDEEEPCLEANLYLKRTIQSSGLVILPRTGHAANLEEPAAFNQAVAEFIATVEQDRWTLRDPRSVSDSALVAGPDKA